MAEETVDAAVKACDLKQRNPCITAGLLLEGAHHWDPLLHIRLVQDYGLEEDVYCFRHFLVPILLHITYQVNNGRFF